MAKLHDLQRSKFASINPDAFLTLQQSWKEEVRLKFEEFKKKEEVCVCVCVVCVCVCTYWACLDCTVLWETQFLLVCNFLCTSYTYVCT